MPPAPIGSTISYGPILLPAASSMDAANCTVALLDGRYGQVLFEHSALTASGSGGYPYFGGGTSPKRNAASRVLQRVGCTVGCAGALYAQAVTVGGCLNIAAYAR